MRFEPAVALLACLAGCASAPKYSLAHESARVPTDGSLEVSAESYSRSGLELSAQTQFAPSEPPRTSRPTWEVGQSLMQGYFGVSEYDTVEVDGGSGATIEGDEGELDDLPVLGGGAQFKLGGERLDYGLEGLFSFAGSANAAAFAVGGGGAVIAVDVDLMLFDLYGGPFVSTFLGEKLRVYASVGPLMQWAVYDQSGGGLDADGDGFGYGAYARAGFEFVLPSRTMLGLGMRWSDSKIDLGGDVGDLDIEGAQLLFTVSRGI
ncbi:MAG: hypothetical protein ACKVWV_07685 [Planctomycetota bacterium]